VINIVTRHDGADDGARQLDVRTGLGGAASAFADGPALTQDHGAAFRAGSGARAHGATVSASSIGAYVPGAGTRHLFASLYGRRVGSAWALAGTGYLDATRANTITSPLVTRAAVLGPGGQRPVAARALPAQSVSQYTLGGTATRAGGERWTHVVTAGVNGYRLDGLAMDPVAVPSAVDSALLAARGGADRGTLRASSVARLGGGATTTTLTLAGDWAALRDATAAGASVGAPSPGAQPAAVATWLHTLGVSAQATLGWRDALFVTAGLRGERNDGYAAASRHAALPMLGATWVRDAGGATVKLRTAYGRGLRPARTAPRMTNWRGAGAGARVPDLAPEEQAGVEGGVDLFFGDENARRGLALHATAFDQRASGLIQQVAVIAPIDSTRPGGGPGQQARRMTYALQNVGVIDNRGLELEAEWREGPLSVTGAFARVDSRVRRLARGYTGDLRAGDRMLEVPARTVGLDAAWTARRWSATAGLARAFDWTNYDRLALAAAYSAPARQPRDFVGAPLRAYWRTYPGITHLRATVSREVAGGVAITLSADNLLGNQRGEPDNVTVLPGRAIGIGARARF
jgi:iron complex outermembrane receptor protein